MVFYWDHPRVCGEHGDNNEESIEDLGSSPRMRGTLGFSVTNTNDAGIIPAYAGNTVRACSLRLVMWDHPRVCGEHPRDTAPRVQTRGSSPRMRGTLRPQGRDAACPGIIPAYAGNTSPVPQSNSSASGSSPRMRGTLHSRNCITQLTGIIPAYAGNTAWSSLATPSIRDHPRVCGEHMRIWLLLLRNGGSSPRMRGTRSYSRKQPHERGIIPAYAGNTTYWKLHELYVRDHPRVCGEHWNCGEVAFRTAGSSPRMRGTQQLSAPLSHVSGIIPAYAGNTSTSCQECPSSGDHPRVCGEHTCDYVNANTTQGSSPRMRGTP